MLGAKRRALELEMIARTGLLMVLGVGSTCLACKSDSPRSAPAASASSAIGPVAEPPHLVATVVVHDPDVVLGRARELLGARGGFLLSRDRVPTLAVELGLPASTIDLFTPKEPVPCAFVSGDPPANSVSFACAVRVRDVRELMTLATSGASPTFSAHHDEATFGDVLTPIAGPTLPPLALGVFRDHLVAATDEPTLLALGPFLDRNLAVSATLPSAAIADVDLQARGPAVVDVIARLFGPKLALVPAQAKALVDPDALLKTLGDLDKIDVGITIAANRLDVSLSSKIGANANSLGLGRGPLADALGSPSGSQAALTLFEDRDARVASARAATAPFSALIDKDDASLLNNALTGLASARGDRTTLGFELGARGPALFGDLSITDRDASDHWLGKLADALDAKSIKSALRTIGYSFGAKRTVLERVGDVTRFRIVHATQPDASTHVIAAPSNEDAPPPIDLFLRLDGSRIALGAGYDAPSALARVLDGDKLTDEPRVRDALSRAPKTVSLALFVDPLAIEKPRDHGVSSALVTLLVDPKEQAMSGTLELDAAALSALGDLVLTQ